MRFRARLALTTATAMLLAAGPSLAGDPKPATVAEAVRGFERHDGLAPVWTDRKTGKVYLALKPDGHGGLGEYLHMVAMRSGIGSTPIGVDRHNPSEVHVLRFRRNGARVFAEWENPTFSPRTDGVAAQSVRESFPSAILWGGDIRAEDADGAVLIDVTGFLSRDAFGVAQALKRAGQGDFHLDAERAFVSLDDLATFPDNLEFESVLTFTAAESGAEIAQLAPDGRTLSLIEHQSLIRLPADGFQPRYADPRVGTLDALSVDPGVPLGESVVRRLAPHFRLEKTDPAAARSAVRKPIVFYVDPAAPEPVRQALVEGARWWADAFDKAGYIDAFKVEVLPPGASALDVRYNVINWVHRETRGWSYGFPITDPRTGEIVKGMVLLGSERMRQDLLIFQGLVGAQHTGQGGPEDPMTAVLARMRQLSAHETGHALGLAHNFAASAFTERGSVMDYPGPRATVKADHVDLSDAYGVGMGPWDRFAVKWLYGAWPGGAGGDASLEAFVLAGRKQGLRYVSDPDARPVSSAHPLGALWDDGPDPVVALDQTLAVRAVALARFGPSVLRPGEDLSELRRALPPIYLFHRYEVEAVAKLIGGVDFEYGRAGDGLKTAVDVPGAAQRRALKALLKSVDPMALDLPDTLIAELSAGRDGAEDRAFGQEIFGSTRTPVFDLQAAVQAASEQTFMALLEPSRLERVSQQGARLTQALTLPDLLGQTVDAVFQPGGLSERREAIAWTIRRRLVAHLANLMINGPDGVRPQAQRALEKLETRLSANGGPWTGSAEATAMSSLLKDHGALAALAANEAKTGVHPPPGMPIGAASPDDGWFGD